MLACWVEPDGKHLIKAVEKTVEIMDKFLMNYLDVKIVVLEGLTILKKARTDLGWQVVDTGMEEDEVKSYLRTMKEFGGFFPSKPFEV